MSYASTGASRILNILKRGNSILLAEGLDVFRVPVAGAMIGGALAECQFLQTILYNAVAIEKDGEFNAKPSPSSILTQDRQLVIVAAAESER